jgi:leader peptidase (prepilin peptidase)/N-methyltransferase
MLILEYLQATPVAFIGFSVVLGLIVGSFLNVIIYRLPVVMERDWRAQCRELLEVESNDAPAEPFNLVVPRSKCPSCGHQIAAWENIPVASWIALRGRCSACKARISLRYPCIELLTGLASGVVAVHFGYGEQALAGMLLTWVLIALSMIDYDHQLLPDSLTLPFLWLGLGINTFDVFAHPADAIVGAIAGYGILWCVFQAFRLLTGKDGMGFGDFKLLALLGAWFGWSLLPFIIFSASALGAIVGVALISLRGHDRRVPIPFGPYLAFSGWIAMLWGADIMAWYLG